MTIRDTPWPDGTPCWIELMSSDPAAGRLFYEELFGWHLNVGDENTGFYASATLDGHAVAGISGMPAVDHPSVWSTYLAAGDVEAAVDRAVRAGATVIAPAMDVMDLGRMAVLQDQHRGTFSIWQAGTHIGTALVNEPGTLVWNEFVTRDYDEAKEFYTYVFGYTYTDIGGGQFQYSTIEADGRTIGGIGGLPDDVPPDVPPHWRVYFAVDDPDATVDQVVKLGGTVIRPPEDMPYGRHADVADAQGAMFSVIRPTPQSA